VTVKPKNQSPSELTFLGSRAVDETSRWQVNQKGPVTGVPFKINKFVTERRFGESQGFPELVEVKKKAG
jgi:hypothetical protein